MTCSPVKQESKKINLLHIKLVSVTHEKTVSSFQGGLDWILTKFALWREYYWERLTRELVKSDPCRHSRDFWISWHCGKWLSVGEVDGWTSESWISFSRLLCDSTTVTANYHQESVWVLVTPHKHLKVITYCVYSLCLLMTTK